MSQLSDFVAAYIERTQISKNQFVQKCVDPLDPSRVIYIQWLDTILAGRGPMPELWRLRALAVGMGVDLEELQRRAVAQWLDYSLEDARPDPDVIAIPVKPGTSDATRRRIRRMAELLIAEDDEQT
jgi:hypothetical protein